MHDIRAGASISCQPLHCYAQTRPGQLDRLQQPVARGAHDLKRLVIRIWKRCSVDNTNSYASCASIFTDKFGDDPHGFGKKVTGKCFAQKCLFERSVVDWDMDGPLSTRGTQVKFDLDVMQARMVTSSSPTIICQWHVTALARHLRF
jgi:hypothetical protein